MRTGNPAVLYGVARSRHFHRIIAAIECSRVAVAGARFGIKEAAFSAPGTFVHTHAILDIRADPAKI
jgi:hypothetical protein